MFYPFVFIFRIYPQESRNVVKDMEVKVECDFLGDAKSEPQHVGYGDRVQEADSWVRRLQLSAQATM